MPLALFSAVVLLAACGSDDADPQPAQATAQSAAALDVAVGFYPYEFVTSRVGGPDVKVVNLTKPGGEPHDLELPPQQVASIGSADLVVYSRGFQPAVDKAVEQEAADHAFDVLTAVEVRPGGEEAHGDEAGHEAEGEEHAAEGEEHAAEGEEHAAEGEQHAGEEKDAHAEEAGADPHVWLDPKRLSSIATAVAAQLGKQSPGQAAAFNERAAALSKELTALDSELQAGLKNCKRREIVTSHAAFGYLAAAYDLEQVPIAGLSPEDEASPNRLAEVARLAKEKGVTTIFFEELVSPKVAESLAREVGAKATVLSPLEGAPDSGDYFSAMRTNLQTLRAALDCT